MKNNILNSFDREYFIAENKRSALENLFYRWAVAHGGKVETGVDYWADNFYPQVNCISIKPLTCQMGSEVWNSVLLFQKTEGARDSWTERSMTTDSLLALALRMGLLTEAGAFYGLYEV